MDDQKTITLNENEQTTRSQLTATGAPGRLPVDDKPTTNWYVITGGPGSGKTTTINLLKAKGYHTTIEHAQRYIDTQLVQGRTLEEVRENQTLVQRGVLDMQVEQEAAISPGDLVFLDQAHLKLIEKNF